MVVAFPINWLVIVLDSPMSKLATKYDSAEHKSSHDKKRCAEFQKNKFKSEWFHDLIREKIIRLLLKVCSIGMAIL